MGFLGKDVWLRLVHISRKWLGEAFCQLVNMVC
uniref:Uncharacterized protein n=1 Tax=Rhizophora mucronata TaxID=61149 RepID=A0A2P2P8N3_RHIMU